MNKEHFEFNTKQEARAFLQGVKNANRTLMKPLGVVTHMGVSLAVVEVLDDVGDAKGPADNLARSSHAGSNPSVEEEPGS